MVLFGIVAAGCVVPFAARPLTASIGFIVVWSAFTFAVGLIALTLLAWRAFIGGDRHAVAAAMTFAVALPLLATNVAMAPGLVAFASLHNTATPQWAMSAFNLVMACGFTLYAFTPRVRTRYVGRLLVAAFALSLVLAAATFVRTGASAPDVRRIVVVLNFVAAAAGAAALAVLLRRARTWSPLDLWIAAFVVLQWGAIALLVASPRYGVGWYGSRLELAFGIACIAVAQATDFGRMFARAHSVESYAALAEFSPDIMYALGPDGRCWYVNERWTEVTGQRRNDALGYGWRAAVHPDDLRANEPRWSDRATLQAEMRLQTAQGYRWYLQRRSPVSDENGRLIAYFGVASDIHERRMVIEREHALATRLQNVFFAPAVANIEGFAFDAVYRPADETDQVGGDWYDVFPLRDGRIAVAIGDVAGHGIDAAIRMVHVREVVRAAAMLDNARPDEVLAVANRFLCGSETFATALVAMFDPATGEVSVATAGHPPPVHVRGGTALGVGRPGLLLGVDIDAAWPRTTITYAAGDRFAFYTDGLVEAEGWQSAGETTLFNLLAVGGDAQMIVRYLATGRQRDDVALLILDVTSAGTAHDVGWTFFSAEAASAQAARPSLIAYLEARGADDELRVSAENVFGELVGNVVRHAPGPIEVSFVWEDDRPVLRVADRGNGFAWRPVLPEDLLAESGRGSFIVALYSRSVEVRRRPNGGSLVVAELAGERTFGAEKGPNVLDLPAGPSYT